MKICIIGGNSFLSTAIGKACESQPKVSILVLGRSKPRNYSYNEYQEIDLEAQRIDASKLIDCDFIIYCVGAGIQSRLKEGIDKIYLLNHVRPMELCNSLRMLDFKGVVVSFGSVFEIGETNHKNKFSEEEVMTSISPSPNDYVVSKRLFSRFVNSYKKSFKHWHFIIPTIYGQGEDSNRLIPYTIHSIQQSKTLHFTSGSQVRQYLHVDDAVNALFHAINKALPSGIYNLESTDILSVKEVVSTIFSQLNQPIPNGCFGSTSRSDEKMLYLALDGSKLKSMIGEYQTIVLKNSILCY